MTVHRRSAPQSYDPTPLCVTCSKHWADGGQSSFLPEYVCPGSLGLEPVGPPLQNPPEFTYQDVIVLEMEIEEACQRNRLNEAYYASLAALAIKIRAIREAHEDAMRALGEV